jgi:2-aminoethylphosphonate-pyruvate transaminase
MTSPPPNPVLFTPGPVRVPAAVRRAFVEPPCNYHRQEAFTALFTRNERDVKALLGVRALDAFSTIMLASTGTGANEACLQTLASFGKGLILNNGFFGARLAEQARRTDVAHVVFDAPADRPLEVAAVEAAVARHPDLAWVYFVAHETRAGLANPVEALGRACRQRDLIVAADVVSNAHAFPLDIEAAQLDFAVLSSAKGLMSVPGLGLVIARNQTIGRATTRRRRTFYLDLPDEWAKQQQEHQPRFAQPVALHAALGAACQHLIAIGIAAHMQRIQRQMRALEDHLRGLGIPALLAPGHRSNVAVNFRLPPHLAYEAFARRLQEQGYYVLYGIPGDTSMFQLSTMGDLTDGHVAGMKAALTRVFSAHARGTA